VSGRTLRIRGLVQRVGYRAWAVETARGLGLTGWVRNRRDGDVELAAWGDPAALDALYHSCLDGPLAARVEGIEVTLAEGEPPPGFRTLPSA
jgi:acylphosphatase